MGSTGPSEDRRASGRRRRRRDDEESESSSKIMTPPPQQPSPLTRLPEGRAPCRRTAPRQTAVAGGNSSSAARVRDGGPGQVLEVAAAAAVAWRTTAAVTTAFVATNELPFYMWSSLCYNIYYVNCKRPFHHRVKIMALSVM